MSRPLVSPLVFALLVGAPIAAAAAQRLTITPTIGRFVPVTALDRWSIQPPCDIDPCVPVEEEISLKPGLAWGLRVATGLKGAFGIEASVTTTATQRQLLVGPEDDPAGQGSARHTVAAVRATIERPVGKNAIFGLAVGASYTALSGEAIMSMWLPLQVVAPPFDTQEWGASLAASMGFVLSRRARAHFSIADNVYRSEPLDPSRSGQVQHDLQLSMGVSFLLVN